MSFLNTSPVFLSSGLSLVLSGCFSDVPFTSATDPDGGSGTGGSSSIDGSASDGSTGGIGSESGSSGTTTGGTGGIGPDPNDHPDLLKPIDITLAPTRAFLAWKAGAEQTPEEASGYQVCYTNGSLDLIDGTDECPNALTVIDTYAAVGKLDPLATYRWKVRTLKNDATYSAFSPVKKFDTDDSLVGLYLFDEDIGNGQQVKDSSGKGNHGALVSDNADATKPGADIIGQALELDGIHDYVDLSAAAAGGQMAFDADGKYTVELRYRVSAVLGTQSLFSLTNNSSPDTRLRIFYTVEGANSPFLQAQLGQEAVGTVTTLVVPTAAGSFHHVVTTVTPQGNVSELKILLNTVEETSTFGGTFTFAAADLGQLGIGADLYTLPPTNPFSGSIDEVAVYREALDPANILNNFCAQGALASGGSPPDKCLTP